MSQLPCKNCITLAVCKQQCLVTQGDLRDIKLSTLYDKCPMLYEYLSRKDELPYDDFADKGFHMDRVMSTIKFLKRPYGKTTVRKNPM